MKLRLLVLAVSLLSPIFIFSLQSQSSLNLSRIYNHIESRYGLDRQQVGNLMITDQYVTVHHHTTNVYLTQSHEGVPVFGKNIALVISDDGQIRSTASRLSPLEEMKFSSANTVITAAEAIQRTTQSLGIASRAVPTVKEKRDDGITVFNREDMSLDNIPVDLVYVPVAPNQYQLAWKMQISSPKNGVLYQSYVNAQTGGVIATDEQTVRCLFGPGYLASTEDCNNTSLLLNAPPQPVTGTAQYRALDPLAESPNHGNFELLTGIEDPTASPYGWHDDNGVDGPEYTFTRGNNVHAYLDRNWDYSSDRNTDGGANLIFDFPFNVNGNPVDNQDIAVTNLFVRNNTMHDFTFRYGFNEVGGNFQETNYSGLGAGSDMVNALAQFGDDNVTQCGVQANNNVDCVNNADFSTPIDGFNGRMRMFTWNQDNSSKLLDILQPADLAGKIITGLPEFGNDITTTPVTGEVVVIDDGTSEGSKGCLDVTEQDLTGKIALIDRGVCDFSLKVYHAQEAGAIGAIICNFEDVVIPMGAGDNATDVIIPSVFITHSECERIRISAGNGLVASLVAEPSTGPAFRDGALDNGIVSHEYGHGISTRLTQGPGNSSCLGSNLMGASEEASGMGEGWSDFFALVTTAQPGDTGGKRRGIGTYAIKESVNGRGIRTYPYSTDMTINPHTYDNIVTEALPHGVGSVWCAMLWDLYWALSDQYGWDPDPVNGTGGNNIAIQLVMDGLSLQPCSPSFTDARDAILLADSMYNGAANSCLIWKTFARRGLGSNANAGSPHSRSDGKEGFDIPKSCLDEIRFTKTVTPEVKAGDEIEVTLKVTNYKNFDLHNAFVEDPIPGGCTYVDGSANIAPTVGNSLVWTLNTIGPDQELTITYRLHTDPAKPSIRQFYDDMEGSPEERYDVYFDPNGTTLNFWFPQDVITHSGTNAWGVGDVETESKHYLQNYDPYTITGDFPVYRFYHYYNTETGADGGFLEITTDDGQSWAKLDDRMIRGGYPRVLQYGTFAIPNLLAFSGLSNTQLVMTPVYIDLRGFQGEQVKIRYRFGTDDNTSGDGWYMDDIELMDAVIYNSEACFTSDESDAMCTEAPDHGTIVDSEIINATADEDAQTVFSLMPNPAGDYIQVVMSSPRNEAATISLYNLTGQLMNHLTWSLTEGHNQNAVDISRLMPGMYVLQVKTKSGMRSEKFIKE